MVDGRTGPADRIPPEWPVIEYEQATHSDGLTPAPQDKHADDAGTSYESVHGLTLDSYIVWSTKSYSLRRLHEAGFIEPYSVVDATGTTYYAHIPNAGTTVAITKETYDAMMGLQWDDAEAKPDLTQLEQSLVDATTTPDRVDAIKMVEHGPGGTWEPEEEVE